MLWTSDHRGTDGWKDRGMDKQITIGCWQSGALNIFGAELRKLYYAEIFLKIFNALISIMFGPFFYISQIFLTSWSL